MSIMPVRFQFAVVLCALALASLLPMARAADSDLSSAAATIGCELGGFWAADLQPWPGKGNPDLKIVATVSGQSTQESDGVLCVGAVRAVGTGFVKEAALTGELIEPPADVNPITNTYVTIDTMPFRYSPSDAAFAVRVTEEFNSSSTNFNSTEFYLFRREGARLIEIFHANLGDQLIDKTDHAGSHNHRMIVKFSNHSHNSAYDLILSPRHGGKAKRFIWNGEQYIAA